MSIPKQSMAFDANGHELTAGDVVLVPCTVKEILISADGGNLVLETRLPMPPHNTLQVIILNSRQVVAGDDSGA